MNAEQLEKWIAENEFHLRNDSKTLVLFSEDVRALFDGKVLVPVEYVEKVEMTIYRMADKAVARLTEIAPNQGWDDGKLTAEMELRPLRAMLAASQEQLECFGGGRTNNAN